MWGREHLSGRDRRWFLIVSVVLCQILAGADLGQGHESAGLSVRGAGGQSAVLYIPAAAHVAGAADTRWRTDLQVRANGDERARYSIALLEEERQNSYPVTWSFSHEAGVSRRFEDVLDTLFAHEGAAALRITVASGSLLVSSRTYNQQPAGTFGQLIPAHDVARHALRTGQVGAMIQLTENADYRTNIGFVNASSGSISITLELYAADTSPLGTATITLRAHEYDQRSQPFLSIAGSTVADGYALVSSADPAAVYLAYASVIDNRTGDAVFISAVEVPGDPEPTDECIPANQCCRICSDSQACGDSCIRVDYTCHQPPGCACNDWEVCE